MGFTLQNMELFHGCELKSKKKKKKHPGEELKSGVENRCNDELRRSYCRAELHLTSSRTETLHAAQQQRNARP